MGDFIMMMSVDTNRMTAGLLIALGVILIIIAISVIINLIGNYKKESEKVQENINKISNKNNNFPKQISLADNVNLKNINMYEKKQDGYQQENNCFYSSVKHFTDTGRSQLRGGYSQAGYSESRNNSYNFVIIKSVICTETRDEIEREIQNNYF